MCIFCVTMNNRSAEGRHWPFFGQFGICRDGSGPGHHEKAQPFAGICRQCFARRIAGALAGISAICRLPRQDVKRDPAIVSRGGSRWAKEDGRAIAR